MPMLIMELLDRLRTHSLDERGEVTIEWGVLVVFIALALMLVVGVIVGGIDTWFTAISEFLAGTTPVSTP